MYVIRLDRSRRPTIAAASEMAWAACQGRVNVSRYEVMFVLRPDLGDAGIAEQVERIRRVVTDQGGSEIGLHDWGVRDLAYRIETHRRGRYFILEYDGTASAVSEVERNLKISDSVLRFMSVRQTDAAAAALAAALARRPAEAERAGETETVESPPEAGVEREG